MTSSTLTLSGMRFRAFHGCLPEEAVAGGEYLVDFSCRVDTANAALSDNLADTPDYSAVYSLIKEEMGCRVNLIETLSERIAARIAAAFPGLEAFSVKVTKLSPPVGGPCEGASVTLEYKR